MLALISIRGYQMSRKHCTHGLYNNDSIATNGNSILRVAPFEFKRKSPNITGMHFVMSW